MVGGFLLIPYIDHLDTARIEESTARWKTQDRVSRSPSRGRTGIQLTHRRPPLPSRFVGQNRLIGNHHVSGAPHQQTGGIRNQEEEVEMSRMIWFVLGIIGLIVVIVWVVGRI